MLSGWVIMSNQLNSACCVGLATHLGVLCWFACAALYCYHLAAVVSAAALDLAALQRCKAGHQSASCHPSIVLSCYVLMLQGYCHSLWLVLITVHQSVG